MNVQVYRPVATAFDRVPMSSAPDWSLPLAIEGNAFAVLRNGWKAMDVLSRALRAHLLSLGATEVYDYVIAEGNHKGGAVQQAPPDLLDSIATRCAGAVSGLGH